MKLKHKHMRIIEPHHLKTVAYQSTQGRKRSVRLWPLAVLGIFLLALTGAVWRYYQPLPQAVFKETKQQYSQKAYEFSWPATSKSAAGAVGFGVLGASATDETPAPTASVIKVATALAVLEKQPLSLNEAGPTITLTAEDEDYYREYLAKDGSVTAVTAGGTLSEYQALQTLLLPSSNNISKTLARWAFGSQDAYTAYANSMVKKLGMTNTRITDASGFSPDTVSTPSDLVKLGIAALSNPVIAQIVGQATVDVPLAGRLNSTNSLLGQSGINGIKTGTTNEAGGCFLASAFHEYANGEKVTVVAAVMGAPTRTDAMNQSKPLLTQVKSGFGDTIVVAKGQQFGTLASAWGSQVAVVAKDDVKIFGWQSALPSTKPTIVSHEYGKGAELGNVSVTFGRVIKSVPLVQEGELLPPTAWWRLRRD